MKPDIELPTAAEALKAYNEAQERFTVPREIVDLIRKTMVEGREPRVKVYLRPEWIKDMPKIEERLRRHGYATDWREGDPRDRDDFGILVIDWCRGGNFSEGDPI